MDRTAARAAAMKLLYEYEMGGDGGEDTRLGLLEITPEERESDYMNATVAGAISHLSEIDERLMQFAIGWKKERITRVDLSILRLAAYELLYTSVPGGVVINEAVELSRAYSTPEAGPFINGVLGNLLRSEEKR